MPKPIVVVGAGLAGLNCALTLQDAGREVLLLEESDRAGGRIATDSVDGFLCDRGFQLINAGYPEIVRLDVIDELEFIEAPRIIEIAMGNKRIPVGDPRVLPLSAFRTQSGSMIEKAAVLKYLLRKPRTGTSMGGELRRAGTGKTYERVLKPFLTGVFLADPDYVGADYGKEAMKHFVRGTPGLPRTGAGQLPRALASRIGNFKTHTQVMRVRNESVLTSEGEIKAHAVVLATDLTTAAQLLDINEIPTLVGCITWYHACEESPSSTARLVVDGENRGPVYNSIVISHISPSYAPVGVHLISSTTGLGVTESEVRRHLSLMWHVETRNWTLIAKYEIPAALPLHSPQRGTAHGPQIDDSLFVAGDYRSVPSQNGALASGRLAAQAVLAI